MRLSPRLRLPNRLATLRHRRLGLSEQNVPPTLDATFNLDFDSRLDDVMLQAVDEMASSSPMLASMGKYHLGWLDRNFDPVDASLLEKGKRIRPKIALLSCMAVSGKPEPALLIAAAIELLHNFTLIHDDIQDASPLRRHRETVWSIWGVGQAINAGDALFAASHGLLLSAANQGAPAETVLTLAAAFDQMTIDIVGGQVMDLQFEDGVPATVELYLQMISRKTAAIVEFAAWAGAVAGGSTDTQATQFGQFGKSLGTGFQLRDDVLGVWGKSSETGKPEADDIRRKKQSLPIVLLRETATVAEQEALSGIFSQPLVTEPDIDAILMMLETRQVRARANNLVLEYHHRADQALERVGPVSGPEAIEALRALVVALSSRQH
ncbi:polyprenyl synthetase family protein [soil metagenome]